MELDECLRQWKDKGYKVEGWENQHSCKFDYANVFFNKKHWSFLVQLICIHVMVLCLLKGIKGSPPKVSPF